MRVPGLVLVKSKIKMCPICVATAADDIEVDLDQSYQVLYGGRSV